MIKRDKVQAAGQAEQSQRFIEAACELGCDESPDAFEAAVKQVARHKPVQENAAEKSTWRKPVASRIKS